MARFASRFSKTPQRNKKDDEKLLYIFKVNSWVYEKQSLLSIGKSEVKSTPYGEIEISFGNHAHSYSAQQKVSFPISSLWLDPSDPKNPKSCKVYATLPAISQQTPEQSEFIEHVFVNHFLKHTGVRPEHSITIDDRRTMLRFGTSNASTYTSVEPEYSGHIPIYDTKSEALVAVLEMIKEYTTARVTGLDVVNLNAVPDRILIEIGFTRVPDYFEKAPSMWYGDPLKLISLDSAGASSYYRRSYGKNQVSEDIVNSFLDILENELA